MDKSCHPDSNIMGQLYSFLSRNTKEGEVIMEDFVWFVHEVLKLIPRCPNFHYSWLNLQNEIQNIPTNLFLNIIQAAKMEKTLEEGQILNLSLDDQRALIKIVSFLKNMSPEEREWLKSRAEEKGGSPVRVITECS
jgi:TusA-related sulfurtransferase